MHKYKGHQKYPIAKWCTVTDTNFVISLSDPDTTDTGGGATDTICIRHAEARYKYEYSD